MRSRGELTRVGVERAMRALLLLVLAFAAWSASRPTPELSSEMARRAELGESLDRWTTAAPRHVHLSLDVSPDAEARAWLRALRHTGTTVTWRDGGIHPLALEAAPIADPRGGMTLSIAATSGEPIAVSDAIGPIDTVAARAGGAMVLAPITTGALTASVGAQHATASPRDSILPRRALVLARATWEAKFIVSALEESGWSVDARLTIAPGVDVVQGSRDAPDTARHAAVIVLDPPAARAASAIARYVRGGGGAIIAGAVARDGALAAIAAGPTGARARPVTMTYADDAPRRGLAFLAITPRADALRLEERDGRVSIAARRVEAGRVVQVGYDETWRWRLGGGGRAVEAHGAWWSALVASVAYRSVVPLAVGPHDDDAPLARLVDALGPPSAGVPPATTGGAWWSASPVVLFALVSALLLLELASRRLRGAP